MKETNQVHWFHYLVIEQRYLCWNAPANTRCTCMSVTISHGLVTAGKSFHVAENRPFDTHPQSNAAYEITLQQKTAAKVWLEYKTVQEHCSNRTSWHDRSQETAFNKRQTGHAAYLVQGDLFCSIRRDNIRQSQQPTQLNLCQCLPWQEQSLPFRHLSVLSGEAEVYPGSNTQ